MTDAYALAPALRAELAFLGGSAPENEKPQNLIGYTLVATQERFDARHLVEVGIGCESCHGGAREHIADPRVHPDFQPRGAGIAVVHADGSPVGAVEAENRACARCHSVLLSEYDHTWEGGGRHRNDGHDELVGGSTINSGEARDYLLGGCAKAMACTTCHDPHAVDAAARLDALATPAGNGVCTSCHTQYTTPEALRAHGHHDPTGLGASCVGCHMPRKNAGLSYQLERYHRIGSPDDPARVEADRPLECATCHRDKTVATLVSAMEGWWGKRYDRAKLRALYGDDLDVAVLDATLARGLPHERTAAVALLGERGDRKAIDGLVHAFSDELPLTRYFAREALRSLLGTLPPVDMSLPAPALEAAVRAWIKTLP